MTSFAKICFREIFKIWPHAKINSRKISRKFIRENKFSRKLILLRYVPTSNSVIDTLEKGVKYIQS